MGERGQKRQRDGGQEDEPRGKRQERQPAGEPRVSDFDVTPVHRGERPQPRREPPPPPPQPASVPHRTQVLSARPVTAPPPVMGRGPSAPEFPAPGIRHRERSAPVEQTRPQVPPQPQVAMSQPPPPPRQPAQGSPPAAVPAPRPSTGGEEAQRETPAMFDDRRGSFCDVNEQSGSAALTVIGTAAGNRLRDPSVVCSVGAFRRWSSPYALAVWLCSCLFISLLLFVSLQFTTRTLVRPWCGNSLMEDLVAFDDLGGPETLSPNGTLLEPSLISPGKASCLSPPAHGISVGNRLHCQHPRRPYRNLYCTWLGKSGEFEVIARAIQRFLAAETGIGGKGGFLSLTCLGSERRQQFGGWFSCVGHTPLYSGSVDRREIKRRVEQEFREGVEGGKGGAFGITDKKYFEKAMEDMWDEVLHSLSTSPSQWHLIVSGDSLFTSSSNKFISFATRLSWFACHITDAVLFLTIMLLPFLIAQLVVAWDEARWRRNVVSEFRSDILRNLNVNSTVGGQDKEVVKQDYMKVFEEFEPSEERRESLWARIEASVTESTLVTDHDGHWHWYG